MHHRLSPISKDNVLSLDRDTLVEVIMEVYESVVAKVISREICDGVVSIDTALAFPCLLMQLYLDQGMSDISRVDQFFKVWGIIHLGLIRDVSNPISKVPKVEAFLLLQAFQAGGHCIDTLGFIDIGYTTIETT